MQSVLRPGFEKLRIWQKAYDLMLKVHKLCKSLPREEKFRIRDQVERSSAAVVDNIAEGYGAFYFKNKIKCFYTSRREAVETQNHLRKMNGKGYISRSVADSLILDYEGLIRGINGMINYIKEKSSRRGKG